MRANNQSIVPLNRQACSIAGRVRFPLIVAWLLGIHMWVALQGCDTGNQSPISVASIETHFRRQIDRLTRIAMGKASHARNNPENLSTFADTTIITAGVSRDTRKNGRVIDVISEHEEGFSDFGSDRHTAVGIPIAYLLTVQDKDHDRQILVYKRTLADSWEEQLSIVIEFDFDQLRAAIKADSE